jgi:hypothetical protein
MNADRDPCITLLRVAPCYRVGLSLTLWSGPSGRQPRLLVDILVCNRCGGRMRRLCAVHPSEGVRKCLGHASRPPRIVPARPAPDQPFDRSMLSVAIDCGNGADGRKRGEHERKPTGRSRAEPRISTQGPISRRSGQTWLVSGPSWHWIEQH